MGQPLESVIMESKVPVTRVMAFMVKVTPVRELRAILTPGLVFSVVPPAGMEFTVRPPPGMLSTVPPVQQVRPVILMEMCKSPKNYVLSELLLVMFLPVP